jgi:hypothetical protein
LVHRSCDLSAISRVCKATCNIGHTGPNGGTCSACAVGKLKTSTGSVECTNLDCAAGKFLTTTGHGQTVASACVDCGAGKYSMSTGSTTETSCLACTPNSDSPVGSSNSSACQCNGYTGTSSCSACVEGKYNQLTGATESTDSAAGKYSPTTGPLSDETCAACPADTYTATGSSS